MADQLLKAIKRYLEVIDAPHLMATAQMMARHELDHALARLRAPSDLLLGGATVRPLYFRAHMNSVAWQARGAGLLYQIWRLHSGGFDVLHGTRREQRPTFEEAEALANAWHRERVLTEIVGGPE